LTEKGSFSRFPEIGSTHALKLRINLGQCGLKSGAAARIYRFLRKNVFALQLESLFSPCPGSAPLFG